MEPGAQAQLGDGSEGAESTARQFVCPQSGCNSSYARIEHLERHNRTHTGLKYICEVCSKGFGRSDVLRRHKKIHGRAEDGGKGSKRALKACQACSSSKLKCDGEPTCKRCSEAGILCVYGTGSSSRETKRVRLEMPDERVGSLPGSSAS